jgi:hypothetical protein
MYSAATDRHVVDVDAAILEAVFTCEFEQPESAVQARGFDALRRTHARARRAWMTGEPWHSSQSIAFARSLLGDDHSYLIQFESATEPVVTNEQSDPPTRAKPALPFGDLRQPLSTECGGWSRHKSRP